MDDPMEAYIGQNTEGLDEDAYVTHYELQQITVLCDDGVERRGTVTHMPFMGNEHQPCTLQAEDGELHAVEVSEVVRVVGRDPRRF